MVEGKEKGRGWGEINEREIAKKSKGVFDFTFSFSLYIFQLMFLFINHF